MSTTTQTHYTVLCVAPDATQDELKAAYRRLIRTCHPDVAGAHGETMTKAINNAYTELSDPVRRSSYDFSIRPQASETPEAAAKPQATPQSASRATPSKPAPAQPAPYSQDSEESSSLGTFSARAHRAARITWWTAVALIVAVYAIQWIEWTAYRGPHSAIAAIEVAVAAFVLLDAKGSRFKSGIFLWFAALVGLFSLSDLGFFTWLAQGVSPLVGISMVALTVLVYTARIARGFVKAH